MWGKSYVCYINTENGKDFIWSAPSFYVREDAERYAKEKGYDGVVELRFFTEEMDYDDGDDLYIL